MLKPCTSIFADAANPGHFFACCGLLELAHRLWPQAGVEGWFQDDRFCLANGEGEPISFPDMVETLTGCQPQPLAHNDPKTAPIELPKPLNLRLDWWLRRDGSRNPFKTWAANATSRQMFEKWQAPLRRSLESIKRQPEQLLHISDRVQGSYGFDSDLGWDALTVGFSFNEHADLKKLPTRPAVELFGAIGLQRFFPEFDEQGQVVRYATWRVPFVPPVASVAARGLVPAVTLQHFRARFVSRGSFKGLSRATIARGGDNERLDQSVRRLDSGR